jgi:hypothetical protein
MCRQAFRSSSACDRACSTVSNHSQSHRHVQADTDLVITQSQRIPPVPHVPSRFFRWPQGGTPWSALSSLKLNAFRVAGYEELGESPTIVGRLAMLALALAAFEVASMEGLCHGDPSWLGYRRGSSWSGRRYNDYCDRPFSQSTPLPLSVAPQKS